MRKFRKVCRTLHRELGYLAVGLTLVYGISGIAVNHAHHWDANYSRTVAHRQIEPVGTGPTAEIVPLVLAQLPDERPLKNTWRERDDLLRVFLEGGGYDVNLATGEVVEHGFAKRPFIYEVNFMHLNSGKAPWTGIADVYAGILCVLALTGPWLVRGRKGLKGRGGALMALGILLPLVYAFVMRG